MEDKNEKLLQIEDLHIHYMSEGRKVCAVNGVSFEIGAGETIGLVGETGAGKTTMALAIMKLIQKPAGRYAGGRILFGGEDLITASENRMHSIRGNQIAMIFQDPMTSLNPVYTVGDQIAEVVALHQKVSAQQAAERAAEVLELVGIPKERADEYPHQFSGGMKQRVCIAMALAANPQLLIADEPTTALDVTIQAQVLDLMGKLKRELNTAMILITQTWASSPRSATRSPSCTRAASSSSARSRTSTATRRTPTRWACSAPSPSSTRRSAASPRSRA